MNNAGLISFEMDKIFWPKIEKNNIKNRKNVTISNIRKFFKKHDIEEIITNNNGIFYLNYNINSFECDLEKFLLKFNKAVTSEKENLSLDAIGNFQKCLNIYGFYGINNPLMIKEIENYQQTLKKKALIASNFLISNKNSVFDEKALSIAKHLIHNNS